MICQNCKTKMKIISDIMKEDNFKFKKFKCLDCNEELISMYQLHELALKY
ncbi:hypothetical protein ACFL1H_03920 [Nanoarchaeota archaeon]